MPHFSTGGNNSAINTIFEWNETDLTQFEEVYRDTGADGVLSVTTNTSEPYQQQLKFTTAGAGASRDWVIYRLLDDGGSPIVIPKRSRMSCRLGPRNNNVIPSPCPWYVDEEHRIFIQALSSPNSAMFLGVANGGGVDVYSYDVASSVKTNFPTAGDYVFLDLDMRKPSTGVDPGGVAKWGGDFGDDVKSRLMSATGWSTDNGSTHPSTSWDAGWDGEVYAAIAFLDNNGAGGDTFISQLAITEGIGF